MTRAPVDSPVVPVRGVTFGYLPALDGIRAVAVLAVLAYHGNQRWARGGFLGVDTFFVLSGFLITSLLLAEFTQTGTVALGAFYVRRARRLLPAMVLVVAVVVILAPDFVPAGQLGRLRDDAFGALTYVSNWRLLFSGQSYFDAVAAPSPLRHLWSLGIEEQWYLVWPAVLVFCLRRWPGRRVLAVTGACALFSAFLMAVLYHPGSDPARVYYGTDTRAQSLLVGATLAGVLATHGEIRSLAGRAFVQVGALIAAVFVLWRDAVTTAGDASLFRGGFLLHTLAVALVITAVVQPRSGGLLTHALSWRPLRWVGMISYGLYLWHWPIYLWLDPSRTGLSGMALLALRVVVTFAVAVVSYYLVEWPIRHGRLPGRRALVALAAASTMVTIAALVMAAGSTTPGGEAVLLTGTQPAAVHSTPTTGTPVLFLGDSAGWSMTLGFTHALQHANGLAITDRSKWGCALAPGPYRTRDGIERQQDSTCPDWSASWTQFVDEVHPALTAVSFGPWEVFPHEIDGHWIEPGTAEYDRWYLARLRESTAALTHAGGRVVYLTSPSFMRDESTPQPEPWGPGDAGLVRHFNDLLRQHAASDPDHVSIVDVYGWLCPHDQCREFDDAVRLRFDGVHYSLEGSKSLARWLLPQLATVAGQAPVIPAQSP